MSFAIILTLAVAANVGGIMIIDFLVNLRWRYRGRNIKLRVLDELDNRWLHCSSSRRCPYCRRRDECIAQCVASVKSEIDAEIQEGKELDV